MPSTSVYGGDAHDQRFLALLLPAVAHIERRVTRRGEPRYEVRWRHPGEPERSRSFPTLEGARSWKVQVEAAALQGQRLDPRAGKRKLGEYAEEWLAHRPLADRTRELYRQQLDSHVLPTFGNVAIARVTPSAVRRWYGSLDSRGRLVAPKCYSLLRAIMASAVEDGLIPSNPCGIRGGGVEDSPERIFVPPELVLELAAAVPARMRAMVLVAGFGGLRLVSRQVDPTNNSV